MPERYQSQGSSYFTSLTKREVQDPYLSNIAESILTGSVVLGPDNIILCDTASAIKVAVDS